VHHPVGQAGAILLDREGGFKLDPGLGELTLNVGVQGIIAYAVCS
jgi:hypothetical protein